MSCTVENMEEKNMAKLTIEVSADEFEKALQKAYEKNRKKIAVNGFRKGKVPRQVVEKIYGPGVFYEDAANELIPGEYSKAADESGLDIVSQPQVEVSQIEKGKPFIFTAEVAVKPEVELGKYIGVEIDKVDEDVTDDEVNAELDKIREQNARILDVTDRPVEDKDQAVIDFEGFVDDQPFEGGKGTDYPLAIGSHTFIDNFEEQLIGANIGDEVDVHVTFPENYQAKELAGKPALFKVNIKAIKSKELPELDDEFAQDVSEFDTFDAYRDDVKKNLAEKKSESARKERQRRAVDKAVEDARMDIPELMVKTQVNNMVNDFAQRLQAQGLSIQKYIEYVGTNPQQFMDSLKPEATTRIKNSLVLDAVVKAENIEVTDDDFEEELGKMAEMYKIEKDKLREVVGEAEEKQIRSDLAIQKAAELIAEKAVEVEPAKEENK